MHYIKNVSPLLVCSLSLPVAIALLPVPMLNPRPSSNPQQFAAFYKPLGKLISLHEDDALRVRKYMERFNTEALTSNGQVAFTLHGNQLMECDPLVCGQPPEPLMVNFHPLTWIAGNAQPAGAPEPVDVTDHVLAMPAAEIAQLRDGSAAADALVDAEGRGHWGPHTVTCELNVCSFFGVNSLDEITQKCVDEKRAGLRPSVRSNPVLEGEGVWMMGVGVEPVFFTCRAASIDDALTQTRQSFPGARVSSASAIA